MPDVIFEKRVNGVALITLNRPDSLNAMGGDLMPLLAQHLDESRWDNTVRCVVLTGAGRAFCAGGDVKNMAAQGGRESDGKRSPAASFAYGVDELRESQRRTSYTLHTMPKPTIAMGNGHAAGAGLSLAHACDIRIPSRRDERSADAPRTGGAEHAAVRHDPGPPGGSARLRRKANTDLQRSIGQRWKPGPSAASKSRYTTRASGS